MAIYQRNRDFQKLFSEINVNVIPLRFIDHITCFLNDGTKIIMSRQDLDQAESDQHLAGLVKELDFYDNLVDLNVTIDYKKVEQDVDDEVGKMLGKENQE